MSDTNAINVNIQANITQFNQSLQMAEVSLKRFESVTESVSQNVADSLNDWSDNAQKASMIFVGMKSAFQTVVSAVQGLTLSFTEMGTLLDLTSQRTNISVESLSKLKYAASQSGVQFETLTDAIKTFQEQLGAARLGDTGAIDKLGAVGIDFNDFEGLDEEEQFIKLAEHISKITDSATRTRTAIELFGDAGYELLPFFEQGEDGIKKLSEEAEKMGLVMTSDGAKSANVLGSSLTALQDCFSMLGVKIGEVCGPTIKILVETVQMCVSVFSSLIDKHPQLVSVVSIATLAFTGLITTLGGVISTISMLKFVSMAFLTSNPFGWALLGVSAIVALTATIVATTSSNDELEKSVRKVNKAIADTKAISVQTSQALNTLTEKHKAMNDMLDTLSELAKKEKLDNDEKARSLELVEKLNKAYPELGISIDSTTGKVEDLTQKQIELMKIQARQRKQELAQAMANEFTNQERLGQARKIAEDAVLPYLGGNDKQAQIRTLRTFDANAWDALLADNKNLDPVAMKAFEALRDASVGLIASREAQFKYDQELGNVDKNLNQSIEEFTQGRVDSTTKDLENAQANYDETQLDKFQLEGRKIDAKYQPLMEALKQQEEALIAQQNLGVDNSQKLETNRKKQEELDSQRSAEFEELFNWWEADRKAKAEENKEPELVKRPKETAINMAERMQDRAYDDYAEAVLSGDSGKLAKAEENLKSAQEHLVKTTAIVTGRERNEAREELQSKQAEYNKRQDEGAGTEELNQIMEEIKVAQENYDSKNQEYQGAIGRLSALNDEKIQDVAKSANIASSGTFSAFGIDSVREGNIQKEQLDQLKAIYEEVLGLRKNGKLIGFTA